MTVDIKLVAYAPAGERLGELPLPLLLDTADPLSDTPSLTMKYAEHSAGKPLLENPIEIAREVYDEETSTWFEPDNGRFILLRTEGDRLEATGAMTYIAPGFSWILNKAVVYPTSSAVAEGQVQDAESQEDTARQNLNAAEDALADSLGYSRNRPVAYDTYAPEDTANIWLDITDTSSLKYMIYSESTNQWELKATHTQPMIDAYNAFVEHQQTQGSLRDAQSRTRATKRVFHGQHAGSIMRTLIDETIARGGRLNGMEYSFTEDLDSAGNAWPSGSGTVEVNVGTSLLRLMQSFVDAGQVDFSTTGRTLNVYAQNTELSRDHSAGVALRYGVDIDEAPDRGTLEHVAGEVLFLGDDGLSYVRANPEAPSPWGTWEASVSQSGVTTEGMGAILATKALESAAHTRTERTRALSFHGQPGIPRPYIDYRPGDYVTAPGENGVPEKQRVHQITLSKDGQTGRVQGNLVLHDRFLEREIRMARQTEALIGGTGGTSGTGGSTSPETYVDLRTPEAPRFLEASADTSPRKGGGYESYLGLNWWWSRQATNGTSLEDNLTGFDVQYRMNAYNETVGGNALVWRSMPQVPGNVWSTVHGPVDYFDANRNGPAVYEMRVRAIGTNGKMSDFSEVVMITVPLDDTPPKAPSRPTASNSGPVIVVTWDGKSHDGGEPPLDFSHLEVEETVVPPDAPSPLTDTYLESLTWTRVADQRLATVGAFQLYERPYGETRAYRLVSVDQNANESTPSAPSGTAAAVALVDTTYVQSEIDAKAGEIDQDMTALDKKLTDADAALSNDIQTAPVELHRLTTGEVLLGSAVAEEIWARKVAAKKVVAQEVLIGSGSNLVANGYGELGDASGWDRYAYNNDLTFSQGTGAQGYFYTGHTGSIIFGDIAVQEGTEYAFSVFSRGDYDGQKIYLEVLWYDAADTLLSFTRMASNADIGPASWSYFSGSAAAPTGTARARFRFYNNHANGVQNPGQYTYFAALRFLEKSDASLIVDGSIYARHINSLSIETGHLAANAVTADKADITSLKSSIIVSDVFQGKTFYGGLFEGAKFRTHASDTEGIVMTTTGLWASNTNQEKVFNIDSATGELLIAGKLQSGVGNGRPNVIVSSADSSYNSVDQGVWFTNDGNPYGWGNATKKSVAGVFTLSDASKYNEDYPLNLRGHGDGGGVRIYSRLKLQPMGSYTAMLHADAPLYVRAGGEYSTWSDQDTIIGVANEKIIRFERNGGAYNPSNGSAANMFIDPNGYIFKSTSASKYKRHLQDCIPDESVLSTPTKLWQDEWACSEFERMKDMPHPLSKEDQSIWDRINLRWHLGTTAEDAIAHGLEHLVTYDAEGNIDGFEYERFAFMLTPFLRILWEDYKERTGKGAPAPTPRPAGPPAGRAT